MIIITGTIKVESENELASVKDALRERVARSLKDAGCIEYAFSQDISDPTIIRLIEKWEDQASLQAHLAIPDEEFSHVLATAQIESAKVESFTADDGNVLMRR